MEKIYASEYFIGGISPNVERNYHLVRFVDRSAMDSCKDGNFLIGSLDRNRAFDNERGDRNEATVTVTLKASVESHPGFLFEGEEMKKYILMTPDEKYTGMRAKGWSMANQRLLSKNLPSLSFALIKKDADRNEKLILAKSIRESLGMAKESPCLVVNKPRELVGRLSHALTSQKHTSAKRLTVIAGPINYAEREITTHTKTDFKKTIDSLFYSGALHISHLFTKPAKYEGDREFRILWIGHSGPTHRHVRRPLNSDINSKDHLILPGIDFNENFTLIENL